MDITFNKPAKSFIKERYNIWYTEQVNEQLNEDKDQVDVEVLVNFSQVKPIHGNWIFEMYKYLQGQVTWLSVISKQEELLRQ